MAAGDLALNIMLRATNQTGGVIGAVVSSLQSMNPVMAGVAVVGAALGAAVVGIGVKSVEMASQYQQSMNMVEALTGSSTAQMAQYDSQLKTLAVSAGVAPTALAQGLYQVISSGVQGKQALLELTLATEDSKIGMTDAATTATALTHVIAGFRWETTNAAQVNGVMLETVTLGQSTFQQYASTITKASSAASQYHVSLETMSAAWATMTANGIAAAQASTDFQQLTISMDAKIGTITKSLHGNGIAFNEAQFNASSYGQKVMMLSGALQEAAQKHVTVTGVTVQAAQAITKISQNIGMYNSDLATLSNKQKMAQQTSQEWATTQGGLTQTMSRVSAAVNVVMIDIGQQLLPVLTQAAQAVLPLVQQFGDWVVKNNVVGNSLNAVGSAIQHTAQFIQGIGSAIQAGVGFWNQWGGVITRVGTAILVFFLPALVQTGIQAGIAAAKMTASFIASTIQTGVQAVVSAAKITASFVASMVQSGIAGWAAAGKLATYIGAIIASGAQSVLSAGKIAASFVASMVQSGVQAAAAGAKIAATFVASMVQAGVQAVITGAKFVASLIPAILSFAATAITTAATAIPAMITGFIAWSVGAWSAAAATIAATWPILLIIVAVAALIAIIVLLVTHWSQVTAFLQSAWQAFTSWLMSALTSIGQFFTTVWNNIIAFLRQAWNVLVSIAKAAMIVLLAVILGPIGLLVILFMGPLNGLWRNIQTWFGNLASFLGNGFKNLANTAVQWGVALIQGFLSGITSMFSSIGSTMSNVASFIGSFLPHSPAKQGELAHLNEYGPNLMRGIADGITKSVPMLQTAMTLAVNPVGQVMNANASALPQRVGGAGATTTTNNVTHGPVTLNVSVNSTGLQHGPESDRIAQMLGDKLRAQFGNIG